MSWGRKSREGNTGGEDSIGLDDVVGSSGVECGRFTDGLRTSSSPSRGWNDVLGRDTSSLTGLVTAALESIPPPLAGLSAALASMPSPSSAILGAGISSLTGLSDILETDSSGLTSLGS